MSRKEYIIKRNEIKPKLLKLAETLVPLSIDQANLWQQKIEEHLKARSTRISPLSDDLVDEVNKFTKEAQDLLYLYIEDWYSTVYPSIWEDEHKKDVKKKNVKENKVIEKKKSIIQILKDNKEKRKLKNERMKEELLTVQLDKKVSYFFEIFDNMMEAIENKSNTWFDIFNEAHLRDLDIVWNISDIDIFSWILPIADSKNKETYFEIARLLSIHFFIHYIEKKYSILDFNTNKENPINKIFGLNKIVALYNVSKNKLK